jgi:integrase
MPRRKKTRGRRANGEGSLYQRKDERWVYEITFKGENKPRYFTGKTADDAIKKKDEALATLHQSGFIPVRNTMTVGQWVDTWMDVYKASDLIDRESYDTEVERIKYTLKDIRLIELAPMDVQKWVNYLKKSGRKDKKGGLAPKTISKAWGVLRQALEKAVDDKMITSNPAAKKLINLPKIPKPQIKHMEVDDAAAFLEAIQDDYMYPAIITDLMIGLRRGELLGLKWKDIDFKKRTVLVRRQLNRSKSGIIKLVDRVKTDTGYRELELPPELAALLEDHKRKQLDVKRQLTSESDNKVVDIKRKKDSQAEDLIFCWPDGKWFAPDHCYRHLQRLLKKHGFERLSVQGLRHTYATSSISLGIDIAVLSKNMGHADGATTTIYLHSDREREKIAASIIENALLKKPNQGTITDKTSDIQENTSQELKKTGV